MSEVYERPAEDIPRMIFSKADRDNLDESLYVPEMSIAEVAKRLPRSRVFKWPDEPGTRVGDIFVFRWARVRHVDGNIVEFPDVFLEFTTNPKRHISAKYWYATFILHGLDKTKFLAHKGGTTTDALRCLDKEAPFEEDVMKDADQEREEANIRYLRAKRPGKRERLRKAA